ncbi:MAG: hypothetical protein HZB26_13795 [Candidatus Hydrogenedentes bacterium]|nr:hypothetical protein [Candidatus Hydrogenedentota bacterium]
MTITNALTTDTGLTLVSAVLGTLWTAFKSSEWYERSRNRRYYKAIQALEAGVEETYRTYVRAIKDASEDGRLTNDEIDRARAQARAAAIAFGNTQGIDVLRELGEDYINLWIAKLASRQKN